MLVARLVKETDRDELTRLMLTVSGHMTTMPRTVEAAHERIDHAIASMAKSVTEPGDEAYLFVLEDEGRLVGISAIYATVGLDRPFYNYRIARIAKASPDLDIRVDAQALHLVNDYVGSAELGTLYLAPEARGGGRGRLLSFTRLMFLAAFRQRFPDRVMAEIRGWTDQDGDSPFWDAVGRKFFKLDLTTADQRSGRDYRFIAELMPNYPIYTDLLPEDAQKVIAVPHDAAAGALKLLETQGFHYEGLVDIFDAGPCIETRQENIPIVRNAVQRQVVPGDDEVGNLSRCLVAHVSDISFSVTQIDARIGTDGTIALQQSTCDTLGVGEGQSVLVYQLEAGR